jgi:hypothetical protein
MNEQENWKILQIIPAQPGWKAVHCEESANGEMRITNRSIICWALVEPIDKSIVGGTEVRGVEQGAKDLAIVESLIKAQDSMNRNQYFLGYDDPAAHKESEYWVQLGNHRIRKEKQ